MRTRFALCLLALLVAAGCYRPKDTCEGSFESFYSAIKADDWDATYEMLTAAHKKKVRSKEVWAQYMASDWGRAKSFSLHLNNIAPSGNVCIANGTMDFVFKERGKEPETVKDYYFSWTFRREADGKWYVEIPGQEKLQGY